MLVAIPPVVLEQDDDEVMAVWALDVDEEGAPKVPETVTEKAVRVDVGVSVDWGFGRKLLEALPSIPVKLFEVRRIYVTVV